jgi:hypothetical protein
VRWPPSCEDVNPETKERPLLEAATKQRSEDCDREHKSVCDSDLFSHGLYKCPIKPITNPNHAYSPSTA